MSVYYTEMNIPDLLEEVDEIAQRHWKEVPFGTFGLDLNLDKDGYIAAADSNLAKAWVAIDQQSDGTNRIIGYVVVLAAPMLRHKGTMQAMVDSFWVDPDYRGGGLFQNMLRLVYDTCQRSGIRFISMGVNPQFEGHERLSQLLEQWGMQKTETIYTVEVTNGNGSANSDDS